MRFKPILLATILTFCPLISMASDFYIAKTDLNVRTGAGSRNPAIYTLPKGSEVEVVLEENGWYKIRYQGRIGYVSSKYLKFSRNEISKATNIESSNVNTLLIFVYAGLILFVCFIAYRKVRDKTLLESVTNKKRGTKSERDLVMSLLKCGFSEQSIFHDLYVEKSKGEFSQSDVVLLTNVGIIVFEVKDYSGWIFGNGGQSQWTKVLAYGKQKYYFYNPIMQNVKHIAELQKHLYRFDTIPFYSIVVFYGDCEFKNISFVPHGTYIVKAKRVLEVIRNILRDNSPYYYTDKNEVIRVLRSAVTNGAIPENQVRHVENIKDMLGTDRIFD